MVLNASNNRRVSSDKGVNSMQNKLKAAMSNLFRPVDNMSWDMMTGQVGISTDGGLITLAKDGELDLNPLDLFSVPVPAFAQMVNINEVNTGDVIMNATTGKPHGFVLEATVPSVADEVAKGDKDVRSLSVLSLNGHVTRFRPKNVSSLGVSRGVSVVRNLFGSTATQNEAQGLLGGSGGFSGGMNPMMLMMMMGGDKDMSKMLPLMMMMDGGMSNMNPMMMMMLMGGDNPLGDLFG